MRFREVQRPRQWWVWGIVILVAVLAWNDFIRHIVLDEPEQLGDPSNRFVIVSWVLFGLGLPLFFMMVKLVVEVQTDEIYIRLFPIRTRRVPLHRIQSFEARRYRPIRDYGGWGWRLSRHGVAFNISGSYGVELVLDDGERIMIGSQKADELAAAIASLKR